MNRCSATNEGEHDINKQLETGLWGNNKETNCKESNFTKTRKESKCNNKALIMKWMEVRKCSSTLIIKIKLTLERAMKAHRGTRHVALLFS